MLTLLMNKSMYFPSETPIVICNFDLSRSLVAYSYTLYELDKPVYTKEGQFNPIAEHEYYIEILYSHKNTGYGLHITVIDEQGDRHSSIIAYDYANHFREAPRYGFLTDFAPDELDLDDILYLQRHHINHVQFYDWMYRHDQLLPDAEDIFIEPLGRTISLNVVKSKIKAMNHVNMQAIAYAAVYASLADYAKLHPDQLLYTNNGEPYQLGDFYYIMDISPNSKWEQHIIPEFKKVIDWGFNGLHLDQYGFPKKALRIVNGNKELVELKHAYPSFIATCRQALPQADLIFNNVSGYPVHTTAQSPQEIMYIEVWDPITDYGQLKLLIDQARQLAHKQTVLAAYLPDFQPKSEVPNEQAEIGALVAMSAIFASGGYHLLLGEHNSLLADSYYPNYGKLRQPFINKITAYYDFIVMYRDLLFDLSLEDISLTFAGGINTEIICIAENIVISPIVTTNSVWNIVKEKPGYLTIQFINFVGLDNLIWYKGKQNEPHTIHNIVVKVEMLEEVEGVYWASPNNTTILATPLSYHWQEKAPHQGNYLVFTVPSLQYWDLIYIRTK